MTSLSGLQALEELSPQETASPIGLTWEVVTPGKVAEELVEELFTEPNGDSATGTDTVVGVVASSPDSTTLTGKSKQLLLFPPPMDTPRVHFRVLQKREGDVIEVRHDTFIARLVPIRGEGGDQEAEILIIRFDRHLNNRIIRN